MPKKDTLITHPGTIQKIEGKKVFVRVLAQSACASCHVKGACTVADLADKIVEVHSDTTSGIEVGDDVTVAMKQSLGTRAVLLAYLLPFLLVIASLIIILSLTGKELLAGLVSLIILVPYYLGLYLLRDRMRKTFYFEIQHSGTHLRKN